MMCMDKQIKEAFDQIHAEEELKIRTKKYLEEKRSRSYMWRIPAVACMLLFLIAGGYWMYFLPTAEIQVEINPSVELGVNRFYKVVSVKGMNEDGEELLNDLDLRYLDYEEALDRVMESDRIVELVEQDNLVSVFVVGEEGTQCETMLTSLETFAEHHQNVQCGSATAEEAHEAHEAGLGCAKYQAYQELKELNPEITTEAVKAMSMREIRDQIQELSEGESGNSGSDQTEETGQGKHHRHGQE